jgi:hypothetical protein
MALQTKRRPMKSRKLHQPSKCACSTHAANFASPARICPRGSYHCLIQFSHTRVSLQWFYSDSGPQKRKPYSPVRTVNNPSTSYLGGDHAGAVEQRREVMERWAAICYATVNSST